MHHLGNVAFGAALSWLGLHVEHGKAKGIKFSDIIEAYQQGDDKKLAETCLFTKPFLRWQLRSFQTQGKPKPIGLRQIWDGHVDSPIGKALVECSDEGPAVFYVTNMHSD